MKLDKEISEKLNGFEQRELVGEEYWKDYRWEIVVDLRMQGKHLEANKVMFQIRNDYGVD